MKREDTKELNTIDSLNKLQHLALHDVSIRTRLLATRDDENPLVSFCAACRDLGFDINAMDLVYAGEEAYAGMRRATNGGGENSPMLENEDDYYAMFMAAIDRK